ncbi:MAG: hypothetical protein WC879_09875 [Melioribacteraceae bacterium]
MSSAKIYFVLYIVLLSELFIVILDRDDAQDAWIKQFLNNASFYQLSFAGIDNHPDYVSYEDGKFSTYLYLSGMVSPREKKNVELRIKVFKINKIYLDTLLLNSIISKDTIKLNNSNIFLMNVSNKDSNNTIYELSGEINQSLYFEATYTTIRELPYYIPHDVKEILQATITKGNVNKSLISTHIGNDSLVYEKKIFIPMIRYQKDTSELHDFIVKLNPSYKNVSDKWKKTNSDL